ncbi:MAG: alpha/beta fold hydrolase [Chloroflexota bacterium]|nr:alpha/beta fold hydrolase [Chloroflexota bacterium]
MTLPQDQFVQVGTVRARYWQVGSGSPLLLLHGIGHSVRAYDRNIEALAAHHTVYALDIIGHGLTDKPVGAYHIDDLAKFVRDFMAELRIPRAHVVGHSMGGGIAMRFASLFREKVDKLVLVAPAGFCDDIYFSFRLATLPIIGELVTQPRRSAFKGITHDLLFDKQMATDELIDWQYEYAKLPGAQQALLSILRTHITFRGLKKWVLELINTEMLNNAAPTLIMWGENDAILPYAQSKIGAAHLPNARLHTFKYCGHQIQYEYADEFNRLVLEFVNT